MQAPKTARVEREGSAERDDRVNPLLRILAAVLLMGLLAAAVTIIPEYILHRDLAGRTLQVEQLVEAKNSVRTITVQAVGGFAVLSGIVIAFLQFRDDSRRAHQSSAALAQQIDLARRDQIHKRFSDAVEDLGSGNVDGRLAGIYALAALSQAKGAAPQAIPEVLAGFLRHRAAYLAPVATSRKKGSAGGDVPLRARAPDVQAAMTVLGSAAVPISDDGLDLDYVDLHHADLIRAHLPNVNLGRSNLRGAHLYRAKLPNARLNGAWLDGAELDRCELQECDLRSASLVGAKNFAGAELKGARFNAKTVLPDRLTRADAEKLGMKYEE